MIIWKCWNELVLHDVKQSWSTSWAHFLVLIKEHLHLHVKYVENLDIVTIDTLTNLGIVPQLKFKCWKLYNMEVTKERLVNLNFDRDLKNGGRIGFIL